MGLGVSIVTDMCLTGKEELAHRTLEDFIPARSYGVVIRKGKFISPQARAFISMIDPDFFMMPVIQK